MIVYFLLNVKLGVLGKKESFGYFILYLFYNQTNKKVKSIYFVIFTQRSKTKNSLTFNKRVMKKALNSKQLEEKNLAYVYE